MRRALPLLALLLLSPPSRGQAADPFVAAYEAGLKAYTERDWPTALARFDECVRLLPTNWRGHFWLALCTTEQGRRMEDPGKRAAALKRAQGLVERMAARARLNYTDPLVLYLEGLVATISGDHARAHERLWRATRSRIESLREYAEVQLEDNVKVAFAVAALGLGQRMIMFGNWQRADEYLLQAETHLPADHPALPELLQNLALVDEQMARDDKAVERLRALLAVSPDRREEMLAGIAVIHLHNERTDLGRKVLAEAGPEARGFEISSARCLAAAIDAKRDPEGPAMEEALALYRSTIQAFPETETYRLVCELGDLVDSYVHPAQAAEHGALLGELEKLLLRQVELRPECPPAYWFLARVYRLRRDAEKIAKYEKLHEVKKEEILGKERFDHRGRPRC